MCQIGMIIKKSDSWMLFTKPFILSFGGFFCTSGVQIQWLVERPVLLVIATLFSRMEDLPVWLLFRSSLLYAKKSFLFHYLYLGRVFALEIASQVCCQKAL